MLQGTLMLSTRFRVRRNSYNGYEKACISHTFLEVDSEDTWIPVGIVVFLVLHQLTAKVNLRLSFC